MLVFALPLIIVLFIIRALKWQVLLNHLDIKILLRESLRVIIIGVFYGMITPGRAGEVARAFYLKEKKAAVVPTVIWEKITDVLALAVLSCIAILLLFNNTDLIYIILTIIALLFAGLAAIMNKKVVGFIIKIFKFSEESKHLYLSSMVKLRNLGLLLKALLLSFVYYGVTYVLAAVILISLDPNIPRILVFSLPIIALVGNIPITISGLGLREFAAVLTFGAVGVNITYGFSFSMILFIFATLFPALIGYLFIIRGRTDQQLNGILSRSLQKWRYSQINHWIQGKNVLDVGCGTGSLYASIPKGMSYTGLDAQESAIDEAKELNKQATFYNIDIGTDNINLNEKFDNIVLSAILEHLEEPEGTLINLKQYLKRNGRMIITTPTEKAETLLRIGSRIAIFSSSAFQDHKQPLFGEQQLISLAEKTGYFVEHHHKFELGLNQIIILKNDNKK